MHIPGSYILLIFLTVFAAVILLLLHLTKLGLLIHQRFRTSRTAACFSFR